MIFDMIHLSLKRKLRSGRHIMHTQNQEKCKQSILLYLLEVEVFILSDWEMKFLQIKFREKQSDWFAKRGIN